VSDGYHAVVWLDHSEAKVFRFDGAEKSEADIHSHTSLQRLHHRRTGWEAGGNPPNALLAPLTILGAPSLRDRETPSQHSRRSSTMQDPILHRMSLRWWISIIPPPMRCLRSGADTPWG